MIKPLSPRVWFLLLVATGCAGGASDPSSGPVESTPPPPAPTPPPPPPAPTPTGTISVVRAVPASGSALPTDSTMRIQATLAYTVAGATGARLSVVVLAGRDGQLLYVDAGTLGSLDQLSGEKAVSVRLRLPGSAKGGSVSVSFGLVPDGWTSAVAHASLSYKVR